MGNAMKVETYHIRWMIRRDYLQVLTIENDCFGELAWSEDDFLNVLSDRDNIGMVVEADGLVVGYVVYRLRHQELRILNLGVCLNFRFHGVGRRIIETLVSKLNYKHRTMIRCFIPESNLDAQLFFRSLGFEAISILKQPFAGSAEDGYEFRYMIGQPLCDTRLMEAESTY